MNCKEYNDVVTQIDEDLLENAMHYKNIQTATRSRTVWKRTAVLAACFVLLLAGALAYRQFAPKLPTGTQTTTGEQHTQTTQAQQTTEAQDPLNKTVATETEVTEILQTETQNITGEQFTQAQQTTQEQDFRNEPATREPEVTENSQIRYIDLTADGKGPELRRGGGAMEIARFSERWFLNKDALLLEGTVTQTYIKQYNYKVDAPGKFENADGRMTIAYAPQTVITTVKITKIWQGDSVLTEGDTLTFEDEILSMDGIFCCRAGVTYVLYLEKAAEDTMLTGRPHEDTDERITEGDNRRSCEYERGYPYQPAIEKTKDGDYIVPETWESLTAGAAADVLLQQSDVSGVNVTETDLALHPLKLVRADVFVEKMRALTESLQAE